MTASILTALLALDAVSAQVPVIDPCISSVASGGFWESDGVRGHYRVVVENSGFEVVESILYLQWLADATEDSGPRIVLSEPVSGIGSDEPLSIGTPVFEFDGGTAIVLEATDPHTLAASTFRIIPGKPGEYTVLRAD
ncbi:MAG: hypothetical protein QUS11_00865 [Candidatus Fermentibacter sp.]|nr:hypothetical protein [Candidatus Fermentibacter sp.]